MRLLSPASSNTKTRHSQDVRPEYRLVGLALSPADAAPGLPTNCPSSTPGCRAACVGSAAGLVTIFANIMAGRIAKTAYLRADRPAFLRQLVSELQHEQDCADRDGTILAVRLNTFSDIPWEVGAFGSIPQQFNRAQFYDYTAIVKRAVGGLPENYALTLSRKETPQSELDCITALHCGRNVAVCFYEPGPFTSSRALMQRLPKRWHGFPVFDGDSQDMRFLDPGPTMTGRGRVCGLRLKASSNEGRKNAIDSGFAVIVE